VKEPSNGSDAAVQSDDSLASARVLDKPTAKKQKTTQQPGTKPKPAATKTKASSTTVAKTPASKKSTYELPDRWSSFHCNYLSLLKHHATDIAFHIPRMGSSSQQKSISSDISFTMALDIIHGVIGCADVARKPELSYRLANAPVKSLAIDLSTDKDWEGCIADVQNAMLQKKAPLAVNIVVGPDAVSCDMFCHSPSHFSAVHGLT